MSITSRGRRRLAALLTAVFALIAAVLALSASREAARASFLAEARADGFAAYDRGDFAGALDALQHCLAHDAADVPVLLAFADARAKVPTDYNRHLIEAAGVYRAALRLEPANTDALEGLLYLYERLRRYEPWRDTAETMLARDPDHAEALRALVLCSAFESRFDDAVMYCERLIRLQPAHLRWRELYLRVLEDRGAPFEELLDRCEVWRAEDNHDDGMDAAFHAIKARMLLTAGDRYAAADEVRQAAALPIRSAEAMHLVVGVMELLQLRDDIEHLLARAAQEHPDETWVDEAAVRRLWQQGRVSEALSRLDAVVSAEQPAPPSLRKWKAMLLAFNLDFEGAQHALLEYEASLAEHRDPHVVAERAWIEAVRARISHEQMDLPEAIASYQRALASAPDDPIIQYLLAEACSAHGDFDLAAVALERAMRIDPFWIEPQKRLAAILLHIGRPDEAARLAGDVVRRSAAATVDDYLLLARAWLASDLSAAELGLARDGIPAQAGLVGFLEHLLTFATSDAEQIELTTLLAHAEARHGRSSLARDFIANIIERGSFGERLAVELVRLSEEYELGLEQQILDRAVHDHGLTVALAEVTARMFHNDGRAGDALRLFDRAFGSAIDRAKARASFVAWSGHPSAIAEMHALLHDAGNDPSVALFILDQPITWEDATMAQRAIDILEAAPANSVPGLARRLPLAKARFSATFHTDDPAAVAEAIWLVSRAVQQSPSCAESHRLLATLLMGGEEPDRAAAIRHLQRAADLPETRGELYPDLIELLHEQGNFAAAQTYLTRLGNVVDRRPSAHGLRRAELRMLEAQGDYDRLIERLIDRIDATLPCESDKLALAVALHRTGRHGHAQGLFAELLDNPSPRADVIQAAARFFANRGRFDNGLALLEAHRERLGGNASLMLGEFLDEYGRPEDAEQWLRTAVEENPLSATAWARLASHYLRRSKYDSARAAALHGLTIDSSDADLPTSFVISSANISRVACKDAIAWLDAQPKKRMDAGLLEVLRLYAELAERGPTDPPNEAELAAARSLTTRYPMVMLACQVAVAAHVAAGDVSSAAVLAQRAAARFPSRHEPAEMAARLISELGDMSESLRMARHWRERTLDQPLAADTFIAGLLVDIQQPHAALRQIDGHMVRIVSDRDRDPATFNVLCRAHAAAGRTEQLLALFDLRDNTPKHIAALARDAHPETAAALLKHFQHLYSTGPQRLDLARAWLQLPGHEATREARAILLNSIDGDAHVAFDAHLLLAALAEGEAEYAFAARHYESVLRSVDAPDALRLIASNNLAMALLRTEGDVEQAVLLSGDALRLAPDHPAAQDTHARALFAAGRIGGAKALVQRGLALHPNDPALLFTYARILHAEQRYAAAAQVLSGIPDLSGRLAPLLQDEIHAFMQVLSETYSPDDGASFDVFIPDEVGGAEVNLKGSS